MLQTRVLQLSVAASRKQVKQKECSKYDLENLSFFYNIKS